MAITFVLNDENKVNSYGFRVKNAGLNLDRFLENPVMLAQHSDSLWSVIGRWVNLRIEGSKLLGDAEFDLEDPDAKLIAGKVERGFVKACSMGLSFISENMQKALDGIWDLVTSELFENSICTIPSNANALKLYAADGNLIKDENVIKLAISTLESITNFKTDNNQMEKINLSATSLVALGINQQPADAVELDKHIATLSANLTAEKTAHDTTKQLFKQGAETRAKALVEEAKLAGKIEGSEVEGFVKDATENYELTAKMFARIPAKKSLSATNTGADAGEVLPKTVDEFEKLDLAAKLAFKTDNSDAFKALFAKK